MRPIARLALFATVVAALSACSRQADDSPLGFVPSDTPFVLANLEPLPEPMRDALLQQANLQLPLQAQQLRRLAGSLDATRDPVATGLLNAVADEFEDTTWQQFAARNGIALDRHWAAYGVGLAPVVRADLDDEGKFEALLARLEKAAGTPLKQATIDGVAYRRLPLQKVQLVLAVHQRQYIAALLPVTADEAALRLALGLDRPDQSLARSGRLRDLARDRDYLPYIVGDIDTRALLTRVLAGGDPLSDAMRGLANVGALPATERATCVAEAARIAARAPDLSLGLAKLDATHVSQRFDVRLAPDIARAFEAVRLDLPGLGTAQPGAIDFAFGLPVAPIRDFWSAQVKAVAAQPFECPALAPLNKAFALGGNQLIMLGVPPLSLLTGVRVAVDRIDLGDDGDKPRIEGRLLLGSSDPAALFALVQSTLKPLAGIDLEADGKPVELPADAIPDLAGKAWIAMNERGIGMAIGSDAGSALAGMLAERGGQPGQFVHYHFDGAAYADIIAQWNRTLASATSALPPAEAADLARQLKATEDAVRRIDHVDGGLRVDKDGITSESRSVMH